MVKFQEEKTKRRIALLQQKEEEESAKILSQKYKIPYADLAPFPIESDALKLVPEDGARRAALAVFQSAGKRIKIGVRNPEKDETRALLNKLREDGYDYELFLVSRKSLERAWNLYKKIRQENETEAGAIQIHEERLQTIQGEIKNLNHLRERIEKNFLGRTTEVLEIILAGALSIDASDIHLEPQSDEKVRLRLRMDGVLQDIITLPSRPYRLLLSRIKLISELKLNIRDRAQDGRFTIKTPEADIEVRTSTLPGPYGENVALRVLNPKIIQIPFEELGMQPWMIKTMEEGLRRPNGMILTTGPTGSGKTTTLYAFIKKISTPGIKVITIEDPIEYHITGVEQTQTDTEKGYDFANGLRSILRQDPDVILVGEIRDLDTAETAIHAALTGHLVFSTLHTNNAAGTIPRLLDLGVRPTIIAPAINVSMAQRLIRKLCGECRQEVKEGAALKKKIKRELSLFYAGNDIIPDEKNWKLFEASAHGCLVCNNTGYKGRLGIFEMILVDENVEHLILKEPSEFEIKKEALRQGQITMRQDGILKILTGITDFAELERVVGS